MKKPCIAVCLLAYCLVISGAPSNISQEQVNQMMLGKLETLKSLVDEKFTTLETKMSKLQRKIDLMEGEDTKELLKRLASVANFATFPTVTTVPASRELNVFEGSSFKLECQTSGQPPPNVTWIRKSEDGLTAEAGAGQELTVNRASRNDSGIYECIVNNNVGLPVRATFNVAVVFIEATQKKVLTSRGKTTMLSCTTNMMNPRFAWRHEADLIIPDGEKHTVENDLSSTSLRISNLDSEADFGSYECSVKGPNDEVVADSISVGGSPPYEVELLMDGGSPKIVGKSPSPISEVRIHYRPGEDKFYFEKTFEFDTSTDNIINIDENSDRYEKTIEFHAKTGWAYADMKNEYGWSEPSAETPLKREYVCGESKELTASSSKQYFISHHEQGKSNVERAHTCVTKITVRSGYKLAYGFDSFDMGTGTGGSDHYYCRLKIGDSAIYRHGKAPSLTETYYSGNLSTTFEVGSGDSDASVTYPGFKLWFKEVESRI